MLVCTLGSIPSVLPGPVTTDLWRRRCVSCDRTAEGSAFHSARIRELGFRCLREACRLQGRGRACQTGYTRGLPERLCGDASLRCAENARILLRGLRSDLGHCRHLGGKAGLESGLGYDDPDHGLRDAVSLGGRGYDLLGDQRLDEERT